MENVLIFMIPLAVSFVLSFITVQRMRLVSYKNHRQRSAEQDAVIGRGLMIGGISFLPLLLISLAAALALPHLIGVRELAAMASDSTLRVLQLIMGGSFLYLIGLKDDMHGTSPTVKVIGLLAAALLFPLTDLWIDNLNGLFGIYELPWWIGMPLTVALVAYITEIFQLMDGIDGLASGLTALTATLFLLFSVWQGFVISAIISAATLGLVAPFWILKTFNRRWRRTIMGNAGSYVCGYMVSYLAVGLSRQMYGPLGEGILLISLSVVMLPMVDTIRVVLSRVRDRRGLLKPDKNMIQHKLIRAGLSRFGVINAIFGITILIVGLTTLMVWKGWNQTLIFVLVLLMYILVQGVINYFIHRAEKSVYHKAWNVVYGQDAWEENTPLETIRKKQATFGTMGLPAHVIQGEEIEFIPDGMNAFERNVKRIFDLMVATFCLIVFSPLFLLSYILIKLDDGGPAIYKQERIGRFGRPFYIYKYRSMRLDAEKFGPALSHSGGDDDPRLTKVGKFLRAHHLDELPQLWNVFKGDMAFIGYRPERKFFIDQIMEHDPRYAFLYQIRPGVTSYATLYNGYTDTMEKMLRRLELDLYYLGHRSWLLDFKVLFMTFLSIVAGKKF